ncbi:hypothetical protein AB0N16_39920 [Streptomyces sp. NPDC051105]|uniref:hypothetical protein n=1 Tax=Streptomyces sp. NPDC051105 TaxID=3154843 RepID=UPI00342004C9
MTTTGASRSLDKLRYRYIPLCTLTVVRNVSPSELLTRMGVDPETLTLRDAGTVDDGRWSGRLRPLPG